MNFLRRYVMVVFVGISLLFGIQVPNFLDQYSKRVDAHLREVATNLEQYQHIADRHHSGDLSALIAVHRSDSNATYREGGLAIERMYVRKLRFEKDKLAINGGTLQNILHMVTDGNPELLKETLDNYTYAVPLNQDALVSGGIIALMATLMTESLFGILGILVRGMLSRRKGLRIKVNTAG